MHAPGPQRFVADSKRSAMGIERRVWTLTCMSVAIGVLCGSQRDCLGERQRKLPILDRLLPPPVCPSDQVQREVRR